MQDKSKYEYNKEYAKTYLKTKCDEIKIRVPKGEKELFKEMAKDTGKSLNGFIYDLVKKEYEKYTVKK